MAEAESDEAKIKRLVAIWKTWGEPELKPPLDWPAYDWMCHYVSLLSDEDLASVIRTPKMDAFKDEYARKELECRVHLRREHWTIVPTFWAALLGALAAIAALIISWLAWKYPKEPAHALEVPAAQGLQKSPPRPAQSPPRPIVEPSK